MFFVQLLGGISKYAYLLKRVRRTYKSHLTKTRNTLHARNHRILRMWAMGVHLLTKKAT